MLGVPMRFYVSLAFLLSLASCNFLQRNIHASAAPSSRFLHHGNDLVELRERSPFNGAWYANREEFYKIRPTYTALVIRPVFTEIVEESLQKEQRSEEVEGDIEEVREIAAYMRAKFIQAVRDRNGIIITVVEEPKEANTFALELALTEVHPTSPAINVVGTTAGLFIPGGGLVKRFGTGSVAFEARITDAKTGQELIEFKDRETDKTAPVTLRDFQRYAHIRTTIDEWAEQFAELAATPYENKVEDSSTFTLKPW